MQIIFRTSDVIAYWRDLEQRGRYDLLAVERYWLHRRRWDGDGMAVDVDALERWMEACMERRLEVLLAGRGVVRCS